MILTIKTRRRQIATAINMVFLVVKPVNGYQAARFLTLMAELAAISINPWIRRVQKSSTWDHIALSW
jgi:hypothetical protein